MLSCPSDDATVCPFIVHLYMTGCDPFPEQVRSSDDPSSITVVDEVSEIKAKINGNYCFGTSFI